MFCAYWWALNSVSSNRPLAGAGQKWQRVSVWDAVDVVEDAPSRGSPRPFFALSMLPVLQRIVRCAGGT